MRLQILSLECIKVCVHVNSLPFEIRCVTMHLFYILIIVLSVVQASAIWDRFKRIYNKQYIDANEEKYRWERARELFDDNNDDWFSLSIFEDNRAKINQHNLEAELGLHTYTLKINQFGDMVHESYIII